MDEDVASMSRRSVLAGALPLASGVGGCVRTLGYPDQTTATVSLLAAGSLNNALENGLKPSVDGSVQIEARGSAELARLIAEHRKDPDIVAVADTALFASPLHPEWYAEFATNALVLAYDTASPHGQRLANAGSDDWYTVLNSDDIQLGRTDPDLDPLGYRSLFMLELATEHYDTPWDLREGLLRRDQVYPETQLVSQFETGGIDAAIVYRNMAVERDYEFIALPSEIDLSDPAHAADYQAATYTLPSGKTVTGGVITYGATIRHESPAVREVFDVLSTGSYLDEFGLVVPSRFPRFKGNVPRTLNN